MKQIKVECKVCHDDNKITAFSDLYDPVEYMFPFESVPSPINNDFALWGFLPLAMRQGIDIHIIGSLSERSVESAKKVSDVWSKWLPDFFSTIQISADRIEKQEVKSSRNLTFFSGGVDSTFSSYKRFLKYGRDSDCLTVHGMEYKFADDYKFSELIEQTESFEKKVFHERRVIKTNAYKVYKKVGCNPKGSHITHIFTLFSCGSILHDYSTYRIAADFRLDQQYAAHPYGSNTATNRLMLNAQGNLVTMDDDISRGEKIEFLSKSDLDLSSLSICTDYSVRPKNCGRCSKCMRTKAMFYASNELIPEIFLDQSFDANWHTKIPLNKILDRVFFANILSMVEKNSLDQRFPGYESAKQMFLKEIQRARNNPLYGYTVKDTVKLLLPKSVMRLLKRNG